jgi:hypothetical protein
MHIAPTPGISSQDCVHFLTYGVDFRLGPAVLGSKGEKIQDMNQTPKLLVMSLCRAAVRACRVFAACHVLSYPHARNIPSSIARTPIFSSQHPMYQCTHWSQYMYATTQLFYALFLRPTVHVLALRPRLWCGLEGEGVVDGQLPCAGVEDCHYE